MDSITEILQKFTKCAHYGGKSRSGERLYDVILSCCKGKSREAELPKWQTDLEQKLKAAHIPFERIGIREERCKSISFANDEGQWIFGDSTKRGYLSVIQATIVMQKDYTAI